MAFDGLMHLLIIQEDNNRRQRRDARLLHRQLRDMSNPFTLPDITFLKLFRLSKVCAHDLIESLEQHLRQPEQPAGIPNFIKVLCSLHFFGHGSYQLGVGHGYTFALSQPSVSRCICEVTDAITTHLLNQWIKFPTTDVERNTKKNEFREICNFIDTIGVIDGTQIRIIAPPAEHPIHPGAVYYCRKHFYAINTQIICDAQRKIININARFPGSVHDSAIWMMSGAKIIMQRKYVDSGELNYLIGDSGYPLEPWLLIPFPQTVPNTPRANYNIALSRVRTIIEHVNGLLKGRFRCTHGHRALHYSPIRSSKIIYSCAVLHNMARHYNVPLPEDDEQLPGPLRGPDFVHRNQGQDEWLDVATQIREDIVNTHFQN